MPARSTVPSHVVPWSMQVSVHNLPNSPKTQVWVPLPVAAGVQGSACSRRPKKLGILAVLTLSPPPLKMPVMPSASVHGEGGGGGGGGGGERGGSAGGEGFVGGEGGGGATGGAGGGGGACGGCNTRQRSICGASPTPVCQVSSKHHLCAASSAVSPSRP